MDKKTLINFRLLSYTYYKYSLSFSQFGHSKHFTRNKNILEYLVLKLLFNFYTISCELENNALTITTNKIKLRNACERNLKLIASSIVPKQFHWLHFANLRNLLKYIIIQLKKILFKCKNVL